MEVFMKARIILIAIIIVTTLCVPIQAQQNKYDLEKEYLEIFMTGSGYIDLNIKNPLPLYNNDNNIEALCFDLGITGYAIINVNSLEITEYSLNGKNPYSETSEKAYYFGPFDYYSRKGDILTRIVSGSKIPFNEIKSNYKHKKVDKEEKLNSLKSIESQLAQASISMATYSYVDIGTALPTWGGIGNGYYCGLDAAAIILKHYDNTTTYDFVPSSINLDGTLQNYLTSNNYIVNAGTIGTDLVSGVSPYTGLNGYLKNVVGFYYSGYRSVKTSYSWSFYQSKINIGVPLIVGTTSSHPNYPSHWVVGHGYGTGYDGINRLYVNDGDHNNNVSLVATSSYYDEFVYLVNY